MRFVLNFNYINKAHGKQNIIPTLYMLEIDSYVVKSVKY